MALNNHEYRDPEVKGRVETIVVPFMFPADQLDVKLYHSYDKRGDIAMDSMVKSRRGEWDDMVDKQKDARVCLAWRRKGHKSVPDGVRGTIGRTLMDMTPRELATHIKILEKRLAKRAENDKRLVVNMAQQTEDLSKLMVARLPIAYCVLLMQINNLIYTERKDQ